MTFAECFPEWLPAYARRTIRLTDVLRRVGFEVSAWVSWYCLPIFRMIMVPKPCCAGCPLYSVGGCSSLMEATTSRPGSTGVKLCLGLWWKLPCDSADKGFQVLSKRWIVERTFGWFNRFRRLSKDYEELTEVSESMIYVAILPLMLRRLHS